MAPTRPLRDVFTDLTGDEGARATDPGEVLRANGHPDLPDGLVAEAVVSYADTAPVEVAEHLASYVGAHSPVPLAPGQDGEVDPSAWLDALATAPAAPAEADVTATDPTDQLDDLDLFATPDHDVAPAHSVAPEDVAPEDVAPDHDVAPEDDALADGPTPDGVDLDFGHGRDDSAPEPDTGIGEIQYEGTEPAEDHLAADRGFESLDAAPFGQPVDGVGDEEAGDTGSLDDGSLDDAGAEPGPA